MKKIIFSSLFLSLIILISGCGEKMTSSSPPVAVPEARYKMLPLKTDISNFQALQWENPKQWSLKNRKRFGSFAPEWSKMIYSIIENEEPSLLDIDSANDVENFCPNYKNLQEPQRLNFWGHFFVALAKPESSWNPTTQMVEKSMGIDPVTLKQVKSEGLLQLSYQDERNKRLDCGFDWSIDQKLHDDDPRRTILNPFLNLRCGIKIFAIQLKKRRLIQVDKGYYWHVLKIGGDSAKKISDTTKSLDFCRK